MHPAIQISRPVPDEYPEWFAGEIELVPYPDLIPGLIESSGEALELLSQCTEPELCFRYAPGKWTIRQIWQHVLDVERILGYRALRYARRDATVLSGFDENAYAVESLADCRAWEDILREYQAVRQSTLELFSSFTPQMIECRGTTGRSNMTVRSVGYLILGHEVHHLQTIRERYLKRG